jgi:tetratricopeptide (TPR) repeat protein
MRSLIPFVMAMLMTAEPGMAGEPAPPALPLPPSGNPQVVNACALIESNDEEAAAVLRPIVAAGPLDARARACYARALARDGNHEEARRQVSVVLSWHPAWVEGYMLRAASAADMGSVGRVIEDLELARLLDPDGRRKELPPAAERIERTMAAKAAENTTRPLAALLTAARTNTSLEQLADLARTLLRASNKERLLGDEVYSEHRRALEWARLADPKNPDRQAALGHFLLDEAEVSAESVEPSGYMVPDRLQEKAVKEAELREARRLFDQGLTIKAAHVSSLIGLARLEFRDRQWSQAERYMRRALAVGTVDPALLVFLRDVMRPATSQRSATVATLRMTFRWEEAVENTVYEYQQQPSATQLATIDDYDAQAAKLHHIAQPFIDRALKTLSKDPVSHDFVGAMASAARDWTAAARAWEKAVRLRPDRPAYYESLARASWHLGRDDTSVEQRSLGRNLQRTTAAPWLAGAWDLITAGKPAQASRYLDRAESVDPGDARSLAYRAVIAEQAEEIAEALALYRAAFALEEAQANQRGGSWIKGDGSWDVRDTGRAIVLRSRIADLLSPVQPERAAELYLQNQRIESWFREAALRVPADPALLPEPGLATGTRQVAPRFGELMRTNRAWAAVELARIGRCEEAAAHFRRLPEYDRLAGAQPLRDVLWKNGRVAQAAVNCFEGLNDQQQLHAWRERLQEAPPDRDSRRLSLTQEGASGRMGRYSY